MKAQLQSEVTEEVNTDKYLDWTYEGGFLNSDSEIGLFYFHISTKARKTKEIQRQKVQ